jgi:hypothetical protein
LRGADTISELGETAQDSLVGTRANLSAVIGSFLDRFAEVELNEDARKQISAAAWEKMECERSTGDGSA